MVELDVLERRIRAGVPEVEVVTIEDLTGGKDHFRAVVVSGAFRGKSRIDQHRLVHAALGELLAGPVHALSIETHTPESWAKR